MYYLVDLVYLSMDMQYNDAMCTCLGGWPNITCPLTSHCTTLSH